MTTYGTTPDPGAGGQTTDRDQWPTTCPACRQPATHLWCERIEGGVVNIYSWISCRECPEDDDDWD